MTKKVTLLIVTLALVTLACLGPVVTPTPTPKSNGTSAPTVTHTLQGSVTPSSEEEPDSGAVWEIPTPQPTHKAIEKGKWTWIPTP